MEIDDFVKEFSPGGGAYKRIVKESARAISDDLDAAYNGVMKNFYGSYSPRFYNRTENLTEIGKRHNGWVVGGIVIDPANAPQVYKKYKHKVKNDAGEITKETREITTENVYDLMWTQGIRGLPAQGESGWVNPHFMTFEANVEGHTGTPYDAMQAYFDDCLNNKYPKLINKIALKEAIKFV